MPSDQREPISDTVSPSSSISATPHIQSPSISELSISNGSDSDSGHFNLLTFYERIEIPREESLRDILKRATGSNDLSDITTIKLQVITSDISLQHLSIHIPQLTELNLDGSIVSSLRDLGCSLTSLKILRICRCKLTSLDGMCGLQSLEELHAQSNEIEDLSPCSWLPYITKIDLKRNRIKNISTVSFLSLCSNLEHLILDENESLISIPKYREIIKNLLPHLKTLDDKDITEEHDVNKTYLNEVTILTESSSSNDVNTQNPSTSTAKECLPAIAQCAKVKLRTSHAKRPTVMEGNVTFTARFPPKVLSPRPTSGSSSDSSVTTAYRNEPPDSHKKQTEDLSADIPITNSPASKENEN